MGRRQAVGVAFRPVEVTANPTLPTIERYEPPEWVLAFLEERRRYLEARANPPPGSFLAWQTAVESDPQLWLQANDPANWPARLAEISRTRPAYETENVLLGSTRTIGLELECIHIDHRALETALREKHVPVRFIRRSPSWHDQDYARDGEWALWQDRDVINDSGIEIISPVLRDCPEHWKQLQDICAAARELGGGVNARCGLHIHFGAAGSLDQSVSGLKRLASMVGSAEDLLRAMANAENTGRGTGACYSIKSTDYQRIGDTMNDFRNRASLLFSHSSMLNLESLGGRKKWSDHADRPAKNTVEFRHPNGTIDEVLIQSHVRILSAAIDWSLSDDPYPEDLATQNQPTGQDAALFLDSILRVRDAAGIADPEKRSRIAAAKTQGLWAIARGIMAKSGRRGG